jgi:hypothetical protein
MIAFVLALALTAPTLSQQVAHCDLVEVNTWGNGEYTQCIFYDWSEQRRRYDIREWMLIKDESHYPSRTRDGYRVVWYEGETRYEVRAKCRSITETPYDPELAERERLPQEQRRPLFEMSGK